MRGRHGARGAQQSRPEPTRGAERDHPGRGPVGGAELGREVEDAAHVGTAEPVDRLVGVADHREVAAVARERLEQRDLAGVGVLVLVDEHVAEPAPQLGAVPLGLDHAARDQVGVVDRGLVAEHVEVLLRGTGRRPRTRPPPRAVRGRRARRGRGRARGRAPITACTSRAKPRVPTAARSASGHRTDSGVVGEQLLQDDVLLGRREQPQRRDVEVGGRVAPHQAVGEGVERRAQAGRHRAAEPGGDPVAQLLGGLARERQRQHALGRRVPRPRCGRRSPRPGSWSCRCPARRARAAAPRGGRRPAAGARRGPARRRRRARARDGTSASCS